MEIIACSICIPETILTENKGPIDFHRDRGQRYLNFLRNFEVKYQVQPIRSLLNNTEETGTQLEKKWEMCIINIVLLFHIHLRLSTQYAFKNTQRPLHFQNFI